MPKPMTGRHKYLLILLLALLAPVFPASSIPAPDFPLRFEQPDGSSFTGRTHGDEAFHYATTEDGRPICQDEKGWWCYASFDDSGKIICSGVRIGLTKGLTLAARSTLPEAARQQAARSRAAFRKAFPQPRTSLTQSQDSPARASLTKGSAIQERHGIVILVAFPGQLPSEAAVPFTHEKARFENLLTQEGYQYDGAVGCALEYFRGQFEDKIDFDFDLFGPVTLPNPLSYYGANDGKGQDSNPAQMVIDACRAVDAEVDFTKYDDDADGVIDNVFIFYAGRGESDGGGANTIWPHAWYVYRGAGKTCMLDGVQLDRYACSSELEQRSDRLIHMASIGTFCHEFSHTLGLPDLYDVDYGGSSSDNSCCAACWKRACLMDGGNGNNDGNTPPYYNSLERILLPDFFPSPLSLLPGENRLSPLSAGGAVRFLPTDTVGEYFIFECRDNNGWDAHIGGSGLLVYLLDNSANSAGFSQDYNRTLTALERWRYNQVNANPDYPCGALIPADASLSTYIPYQSYIERSSSPLSFTRNIGRVFFPAGGTSLSNRDRLVFRSGQSSPYSVTDVHLDGNDVVFTLSSSPVPPTPVIHSVLALQDCALVQWEQARLTDDVQAWIACTESGEEAEFVNVAPYEKGKYFYCFENLTPGKYYRIEIYFTLETMKSLSASQGVTTAARRGNTPYICVKQASRNADGTFKADAALPLRLYNASNASSVVWYFDGQEVSVGPDGYFSPGKSGRLKAEVIYPDGKGCCIFKQITVR